MSPEIEMQILKNGKRWKNDRGQQKERTDAVKAAVPLGFLGEPKDISDCLAYIVNAKYLTGQCISPNGGYAMYL